jgi:sterol desaturase/sphingolipid hydroxylase (fatty acid hydroxylase superfamily)
MIRSLVQMLYAPVMLIAWNALAIFLTERHFAIATIALLLPLAIAASYAAERIAPYERRWNASHGDRWRDAAHALVNESLGVAGLAAIPFLDAVVPCPGMWPRDWPLVAQWLLAVLAADAGITLAHWASHRWRWLWRFHAVHHSVERLYGLNGLMKHPLHQALETLAGVAPLVLAGMPRDIGALLAFSIAVQLLLQHSNVDMRIGPLRHVLALAPVHRFHHRNQAVLGDVNFGLFTTLWDRLLGTTTDDPAARFAPGDFGIGDRPAYPRRYFAQLLEPFRSRSRSA